MRLPSDRPLRGGLLLVLLAGTAVAAVTGAYADLCLAGLALAGPLLAAHLMPGRACAVIATAAVAIALVILLPLPGPSAPAAWTDYAFRLLIVGAGGGWACLTARAHAHCRTSLARVTRIAELAQRAVVHPLPDRIGRTRLAVHTSSATSGALVGGDLHDAVLTPAGMRLIIGDVRGHGIDTVPLAAAVLAAFRHSAAAETDLAHLARTIDTSVEPELGPEDFVTVLLADFLPAEVHLVNCGHPPPLRVGRRLQALEPPQPTLPLGLSPVPHVHRVRLDPSERLLLYTDGLTEARDRQDQTLSFNKAVHIALTAPTLDQSLDRLLDLFHRHALDTRDDITLILTNTEASSHVAPASRSQSTGFSGT